MVALNGNFQYQEDGLSRLLQRHEPQLPVRRQLHGAAVQRAERRSQARRRDGDA